MSLPEENAKTDLKKTVPIQETIQDIALSATIAI